MIKKLLTLILLTSFFASTNAANTIHAGKPTRLTSVGSNQRSSYNESSPIGIIDVMNNQNAVKIFPNPTHDVINISFDNAVESNNTLVIFDVSGKKVMEQNINKQVNSINISNLNSGGSNKKR